MRLGQSLPDVILEHRRGPLPRTAAVSTSRNPFVVERVAAERDRTGKFLNRAKLLMRPLQSGVLHHHIQVEELAVRVFIW
jgi:hypothetical protein